MEEGLYVVKRRTGGSPLFRERGPILGRLDMELTERCNNNCIHCCINLPSNDVAAKKRELDSSRIKGILQEAARLGCLTVKFSGGEPLLREDFSELYLFSRKLGLRVLIFTNATLITPELADLLARIPPLVEIEITLYGMKKQSYEAVTRTPGSFDAAWRGINLLIERKIPFVVKGVFLPQNRGETDEFSSWAKTLPWMNEPPIYTFFLDLRSRREPLKSRAIEKLRLEPEEAVSILASGRKHFFSEMKEFCQKFMGPSGDKLFTCGSGLGSGCVDAYGNIQPCMMLRHPRVVRSLEDFSLKDAFGALFPEMRRLRAKDTQYLARCARCFIHGLCDQCPAKSWTEHGTLDTPAEYFCRVAHAQARYLGLLEAGESAWEVSNWRERLAGLEKNCGY